MKYYTSIEQSKKLLELGLSPESADLIYGSYAFDGSPENGDENLPTTFEDPKTKHWYYVDFTKPFYTEDWAKTKKYPDIPCWSVGKLLELMKSRNDCNFLSLNSNKASLWSLKTSYFELANWREIETIGNTPVEVCYNMIVHLCKIELFEKNSEKIHFFDEKCHYSLYVYRNKKSVY